MSSRRFRSQPQSVAAVRRFVRDALKDQPPEIVDAAELMACELATNCVRHAHTDFELAIDSQAQIRVEVRDTDRSRPMMRAPTPEEPSGRGLLIVDAMSDTWGIIPSSTGKTVWFALKPGVSEEAPAAADSERWKRDGGGRGDVHVSERARKRPRALALAARA
jgi:anti-sigma regulatory factor (Ser/Thr protein kinase)